VITPRDILDVADVLITGANEAEWRSAVSRAYYCVFHAARRLLGACGFDVPRADQAHAYLWLRLANSGHPDVQQAGDELNDLRRVRNWADYDVERDFPHTTAADFVQLAESLLTLLQTAAAEAGVRTQITAAIRVYERDVLREVTWHA
jgi:uncharacterized protein (UPF0332 family)